MSKIQFSIPYNLTQIPHYIICDNTISSTSKAIYLYIVMRLNQNRDWDFSDNDIMQYLKEGRDAFTTAKKALIQAGYLKKLRQNKRSDGTFAGYEYEIRAIPDY